jgi:hypothetical protein
MHSFLCGLAFLAMVMAPCVVAMTVDLEEEDANFPGEAPGRYVARDDVRFARESKSRFSRFTAPSRLGSGERMR